MGQLTLNIIEQSTVRLLLLDPCGTIVVLYNAVPLTRLYPPLISGSKFCNISASPGRIENTSLFNVNPPAQLTTKGDIKSVVGISFYLVCLLYLKIVVKLYLIIHQEIFFLEIQSCLK